MLTESLPYLLSSSVYPVHQLVSALPLLFQVHLQLCDPVLYKQSSVSPVSQPVRGSVLLSESMAWYGIVIYLHEFDLASSVFFSVGLCLGLALHILEFALQCFHPEHGLVALPLTLLQFSLLL